jgi:hypothetical protein
MGASLWDQRSQIVLAVPDPSFGPGIGAGAEILTEGAEAFGRRVFNRMAGFLPEGWMVGEAEILLRGLSERGGGKSVEFLAFEDRPAGGPGKGAFRGRQARCAEAGMGPGCRFRRSPRLGTMGSDRCLHEGLL